MKIVVDSSVFLSIYLDDSNSKDALQMISNFFQKNVVLVVPLIVYFEVVNTLKRKLKNPDNLLTLDYKLNKRWYEK